MTRIINCFHSPDGVHGGQDGDAPSPVCEPHHGLDPRHQIIGHGADDGTIYLHPSLVSLIPCWPPPRSSTHMDTSTACTDSPINPTERTNQFLDRTQLNEKLNRRNQVDQLGPGHQVDQVDDLYLNFSTAMHAIVSYYNETTSIYEALSTSRGTSSGYSMCHLILAVLFQRHKH